MFYGIRSLNRGLTDSDIAAKPTKKQEEEEISPEGAQTVLLRDKWIEFIFEGVGIRADVFDDAMPKKNFCSIYKMLAIAKT